MTESLTRRKVLAGGGATLGLYMLGGQLTHVTAAEATSRGFTPQTLTHSQLSALETVADALVPGAQKAGIAAYIDSQLAASAASKLMAKYVGVDPKDQAAFYTAALSAAAAHPQLTESADAFVRALAQDAVADWQGPPGSYFTFVLRADALDVVYGTPDGFASLDIPYSAHIQPEVLW